MKNQFLIFGTFLTFGFAFSQNTFPTTSGSNVGIGTTSPTTRLQVTSATSGTSGVRLTNLTSATATTAGNSKALSVDANGNIILTPVVNAATSNLADVSIYSTDGSINENRVVTLSSANLTINPYKAESPFFISGTTGNVGIGNNIPTEKLEVTGSVRARQGFFRYSPDNGTNYATFADKIKASLVLSAGTPLTDGGSDAATFNFMDFSSNTTDTPNPTIWLEMMDRMAKTRFRFFAQQDNASEFSLFDKNQSEFFKVTEDGSGNTIMQMLNANSFLGIGTSSFTDGTDTYKLSVNGAIRANRVRVYTSWADFVFDKKYKLPTIEEVEKNIQENGHLKDIPSAKEVEEKGIELGEMNKLLLQKVEELTLYIIELNKEIKEVKSQIKMN